MQKNRNKTSVDEAAETASAIFSHDYVALGLVSAKILFQSSFAYDIRPA